MAIVVNTNLGGRKMVDTQGLKVVQCELTVQATDFPTTGLDLSSILDEVGLKAIVAVIGAYKRAAAGTTTTSVLNWNPSTGLLFNSVGTLSNTGLATATAAVNGDVVSLTLLGY